MEKKFNTMSIALLVLHLGVPAMFAQFFNVLYSIVDRIFVGNINDIGDLALASVGVCTPVLTAISAFANMVGVGGSTIMSMSLGRGDKKTAQKTINNAMLMLVVISVSVTIISILFKRQLLFILGCSENIYPYANKYFTIYILGTVFALCGLGMNQFILAQGYARQGMISVIIGSLTNVILDFIFIYILNKGISGAALATVISQFCSCAYVILFLHNKKRTVYVGFGYYNKKLIFRILIIGVMPFLITLLDNFILILMNMSLRKWGGTELGDIYIAGAAVVQSFMIIVNCPALGITSGCGTIYSFHYGSGNYKKVMETFKYVLILCGLFIGFLLLIVQIFPEVFVGMFIRDNANVILTSGFIKKYTIGLLGIAVQCAFVDGLTSMGKVRYAMPLSLFRKMIYVLGIILLPYFTKLENIFYVGTISDVIGAGFTLIVFSIYVVPKLKVEMI